MIISKSLLKIILILCISLLLNACSHKKTIPEINVELYGKWTNDSNCILVLAKQVSLKNNTIMVKQFTDSKTKILNNLNLTFKKDGIYTLFNSANPDIDFKIVYVEGMMTIDKYCQTPLHKIDN